MFFVKCAPLSLFGESVMLYVDYERPNMNCASTLGELLCDVDLYVLW